MLYVRGRFLFIHIPRTAGTSIAATLAKCVLNDDPRADMLLATGLTLPYHQHATADELRDLIPDWDSIHKFAVYRNRVEIIESDYRLHRALDPGPGLESGFADSIRVAKSEKLVEFAIRRWGPWTGSVDPWDHWTSGEAHRYHFDKLETEWPRLLRDLSLPELSLIRCNESR